MTRPRCEYRQGTFSRWHVLLYLYPTSETVMSINHRCHYRILSGNSTFQAHAGWHRVRVPIFTLEIHYRLETKGCPMGGMKLTVTSIEYLHFTRMRISSASIKFYAATVKHGVAVSGRTYPRLQEQCRRSHDVEDLLLPLLHYVITAAENAIEADAR
jgi:hypothetical protein